MLRSLYSGITGLNANALELDVIGNNIANSNTIGYKASRVTFREMLSQTLRPASRPVSGARGGINPMQIGLGTSVGSIDNRFTQGHLQTTGMVNDLALQGDGFFVLSDGTDRYFTRAGAFGLDAENYLVDPGTGLRVQGLMADASGQIQPGEFTDIRIDSNMIVPAQASTQLRLFGNLDANSDARGTILESAHFMAAAEGTDLLTELYGSNGDSLGLIDGDEIALTGMITTAAGSTSLALSPFHVGGTAPDGGTTLDDLVAWIQQSLEAQPDIGPGGVSVSVAADGSLEITNNATGVTLRNLMLTVPGRTDFNTQFRFATTIPEGGSGSTWDPGREAGRLRAAATSDDRLVDLFNSRGESLGLNVSPMHPQTTLSITGSVGSAQAPSYDLVVDDTTTVADLLTGLQIAFGISTTPVTINSDGEIVLQGETGTDNALGQVDIREVGEVNPTLETSFDFTQIQQADDGQQFTLSTAVYDSLGDVHNILFRFTKVVGRNEWVWTAEMEGDEVIVEGGSGTVTFSDTGEVISFRYSDDSGALTFRPQSDGSVGAEPVTLNIDVGQFGGTSGLTQFATGGSLQSLADGYTVGHLLDYEINEDGRIIGRFSNDTLQTLAQIGIARFANNEGLVRAAGNTFRTSSNSGTAMYGFAGGDSDVSIVSGTLEGSNVDLTEELTKMVVAQRAFQANARVITTGDQILQELVSMLR